MVVVPALLGLAVPTLARAAPLPLSEQPYGYTVLDQDLRDALRQFGANNGLRVVVSDAVQGRVRGRLGTLTPRGFLDRLAADFGFDWFYDGFTLCFTAVGESVNRMISTGTVTPTQLDEVLNSLGISDSRFTVRPLRGQNLVMVAGPPRFVEMVQQAAAALASRAGDVAPAVPPAPAAPPVAGAPGGRSVTVYRGREQQQVGVPER